MLILIYTFKGGIKTVVWTDTLQTTFLILAALMTVVIILKNLNISFAELMSFMDVTDRTKFRRKYIHPLLKAGILEQTIPDKTNSRNQKYQLTIKGIELINTLKNNGLDIANKLQKRT